MCVHVCVYESVGVCMCEYAHICVCMPVYVCVYVHCKQFVTQFIHEAHLITLITNNNKHKGTHSHN